MTIGIDDPYDMSMRLCDDSGMVSHAPIVEDVLATTTDISYLDRHNRMARETHRVTRPYDDPRPEITEPYACTGSAHLMGMHIRCSSPAHDLAATTWHDAPLTATATQMVTPVGTSDMTNAQGPAALFMQVLPSYTVTWQGKALNGQTFHLTTRVSDGDLEAFLRTLRFNGCEDYHVTKEKLF